MSNATETHPPDPERRRSRIRLSRRTQLATAAAAVVIAVVVVAVDDGGATGPSKNPGRNGSANLQTVRRGTLSQQVDSSGTLGYVAQTDGSPYSVVNLAAGALTELPSTGSLVRCGQVLYRIANDPVLLLCGATPAYRRLSEGDTGPDVRELNANLVHLGYANSSELDPSSDYFSSETDYALEQLQAHLGEDQTGSLALGQAVFLPGPLRVANTTATLGAIARPGIPIMQATSIARQVEVALDAGEQSSVKVGDKALITLPDNHTTPGTVTRIGTVASSSPSSPGSSPGSGSSTATIPVYVTLDHPQDAGRLDQAPVQVQLTTAGIDNALIVPINALLALSSGRYVVETVDARGQHQLVPIALGAFDDADGLVQVSGALRAGDRVVVPSI